MAPGGVCSFPVTTLITGQGTVTAGGPYIGGETATVTATPSPGSLFTGFGVGSFLFGEALSLGFRAALLMFSTVQLAAAGIAFALFSQESSGGLARPPLAAGAPATPASQS